MIDIFAMRLNRIFPIYVLRKFEHKAVVSVFSGDFWKIITHGKLSSTGMAVYLLCPSMHDYNNFIKEDHLPNFFKVLDTVCCTLLLHQR